MRFKVKLLMHLLELTKKLTSACKSVTYNVLEFSKFGS